MLVASVGICIQFGAGTYYLIEQSDYGYIPKGVASKTLMIYASGSVLLCWGLAINAKGKWQSPWWGLFGVLGLIGAIVVAAQPDRHKAAEREKLINKKIDDLPEQNAVEFFCKHCGYQLNGITGQQCPECGTWFNPDDLDTVVVAGTGLDEAPWMGRWSLICGIMAIFLGMGVLCGPVLSIAGISFGHCAMYQIKRKHLKGFGVALAGLMVSYFAMILSGVLIFMLFRF